jgi:heme/copper-type cytochrome/quinol oxidase subunit 3
MGDISDDKTTNEKLFAWARLVGATIVFIVGSVTINRLIEAMAVKGGNVVRPIMATGLIFMLIFLTINILRLQ